jgi:hypothetical protein
MFSYKKDNNKEQQLVGQYQNPPEKSEKEAKLIT